MEFDKRKWARNAVILLLMTALTAYVIYHCLLFFRGDLTTTVVVRQTEQRRESYTAYLFRKEQVLTTSKSGAVQVLTEADGAKVAVGTEVARVFDDGDGVGIYEQLCALDEEIAFYRACLQAKQMQYNDLPSLGKTIDSTFSRVMAALADGRMDEAGTQADALLVSLNQRQILMGTLSGMESALQDLLSRREMLEHAYVGSYESIQVAQSGYYFRSADGYEDIFSADKIESLTPSGLCALAEQSPADTGATVGKLVTDFAWYTAFLMPNETAENFEAGQTVVLTFEEGVAVSMTLEEKVGDPREDMTLMIFRATDMPAGFSYRRVQTVSLAVSATSGLRLPETALIYDEDGSVGVYILDVAYVRYRKVDIIWEGDGYVLAVEYDRSKYGLENELAFQDLVITDADEELFDGKVYR